MSSPAVEAGLLPVEIVGQGFSAILEIVSPLAELADYGARRG
jgi:hypothetical protein